MKKLNIIVTSAVLMTTLFVGASEAGYIEPGSEADPLVSKSYVEKKFNQVKNSSDSNQIKLEEIEKNIENILENNGNNNESGNVVASENFKVVELKEGQTIIAEENTEIIVRSGRVSAIAGIRGGISDITGGIDLQTGDEVSLNHHLLIPRSDGRGIEVMSNGTFIMIKGKYTKK